MNCIRCQMNPIVDNSSEKTDPNGISRPCLSVDARCQNDVEVNDVGRFAEIAGCLHRLKGYERQLGTPLEEDLGNWGHHSSSASVPDAILQASAGDEVTFVFTNQVDGKLTPIESAERSMAKEQDGQNGPFNDKILNSLSQQPKKKSCTSDENSRISNAHPTLVSKSSIKLLRTLGNGLRKTREPDNVQKNQVGC